jgi:maltooligosyltrehalose trehalohydrolase
MLMMGTIIASASTAGLLSRIRHRDFRHLARSLAQGFAYQGEASAHRAGRKRGEPSRHLPPIAFIAFLQNHDQIGNRAFGERLLQLADLNGISLARATFSPRKSRCSLWARSGRHRARSCISSIFQMIGHC